jgi:hypothetical protein
VPLNPGHPVPSPQFLPEGQDDRLVARIEELAMSFKQQIFALLVSLLVFASTINLVRTKKLREEYSTLWLAISTIIFLLVLNYDLLVYLSHLTGSVLPTTTLFIGAIIFLILIAMQFSIKISKLTDQLKNLVQDNALIRTELEKLDSRVRDEKNVEN